jgi:hypothetical protein
MTAEDALRQIRTHIYSNGNMSTYAAKHKLSVAFVSAVMTKRKPIPKWMLDDIGLELSPQVYRRKA